MRRLVPRAVVVFALLFAQWLAAQPTAQTMTNQDVMDLVALGLSDDVVTDKIHAAEATNFDTSLPALKSLKQANVSDAVIRAMINPHLGATSNSTSAAQAGDPNDPNTPHDPGIYLYAKGQDGVQMTMLEPTVYSQGKSGGILTSAMTYGIAKVKWKAVVRGAHANAKSSDAGMAFYFYFEETGAGLSHAWFGGTSTPNEFTLLKFDVKKDERETVVMKANIFGSSSGTDEKANTGFSFTKIRPGVYKVVPNEPLKPGEYCFLSSSGIGVGAYGAGAAGAGRLFDFGVLRPR
jgi:hypothetical protein